MKKPFVRSFGWTSVSAALVVLSLSLASVAEARIGGGRSSGSRGFRGFGTRSTQMAPNSPSQGGYSTQQRRFDPATPQPAPRPLGASGGLMRGLLGGLAGGMIGSMLFGGLSHAAGGLGGGGIGLLDILLLAGLGFLLFRLISGRKTAMEGGPRYGSDMSHYEKLRSVAPGPYAPAWQSQEGGEQAYAGKLRMYDPGFDLLSFKDQRMDDFLRLQNAWNHRDLSSVAGMIGPELRVQLDADIAQLKSGGRVNRIENVAVRGTELVDVWQEYGREFVTLRFRANLIDYTVDELSGQVVAGDKSNSVKFEEDWTFVRDVGAAGPSNTWILTAIEA